MDDRRIAVLARERASNDRPQSLGDGCAVYLGALRHHPVYSGFIAKAEFVDKLHMNAVFQRVQDEFSEVARSAFWAHVVHAKDLVPTIAMVASNVAQAIPPTRRGRNYTR